MLSKSQQSDLTSELTSDPDTPRVETPSLPGSGYVLHDNDVDGEKYSMRGSTEGSHSCSECSSVTKFSFPIMRLTSFASICNF
mmetsp:Transcript_86603/g.150768  ORF Transcript_86603/g.150768 Transcript_86603/m.150768 type:complete len:83 (-) Transcript_86603:194-442(-)